MGNTTSDGKQNFDPDLSPEHEVDRQAAESCRLHYDAGSETYRDEDACLARDRFDQYSQEIAGKKLHLAG